MPKITQNQKFAIGEITEILTPTNVFACVRHGIGPTSQCSSPQGHRANGRHRTIILRAVGGTEGQPWIEDRRIEIED